MSEEFDAYHKLLGIPPEEQPPHYYRLLGLREFEEDTEVIEAAARRQLAFLSSQQIGPQGRWAKRLSDEITKARDCLLSPERRAEYDQRIIAGEAVASEQNAAQPQAGPGQSTSTALGKLFSSVRKGNRAHRGPSPGSPAGSAGKQRAGGTRGAAHGPRQRSAHRPASHPQQSQPPKPSMTGARLYLVAGGIGGAAALLVTLLLLWTSGGSTEQTAWLVFDWSASARGESDLQIDGRPVAFSGEGPLEVRCAPGERRVTASRKRFLTYDETVTLQPGERRRIEPRWRDESTLVLVWPASERSDARLHLDGHDRTFESLDALASKHQVQFAVPAGTRDIRITRPGFGEFRRTIVVPAKGQQMLSVVMVPASTQPPVDLLALTNVARDAYTGAWTREAGGAVLSPSNAVARLAVPYVPPEEYVLAATVERRTGSDCLSFILVAGGRQVALTLDGWNSTLSGLDTLDSQRLDAHDQAYRGTVAATGQPVEVTIVVRKGQIQAVCDEQAVADWAGDESTLGLVSDLATLHEDRLGLASWRSTFRISRLRLTPIRGQGRVVEQEPGPEELVAAAEQTIANPGPTSSGAAESVFQGHRYKLVRQPLTWREAVLECERLGGSLCSVESAEEHQFLVDHVLDGQSAWLGGTDVSSEGLWTWINGQPFTFTKWAEGAPQNEDDAQHHLEIRPDGTWSDFYGDSRKAFVCKWDQASVPAPADVRPVRSESIGAIASEASARIDPRPGHLQRPCLRLDRYAADVGRCGSRLPGVGRIPVLCGIGSREPFLAAVLQPLRPHLAGRVRRCRRRPVDLGEWRTLRVLQLGWLGSEQPLRRFRALLGTAESLRPMERPVRQSAERVRLRMGHDRAAAVRIARVTAVGPHGRSRCRRPGASPVHLAVAVGPAVPAERTPSAFVAGRATAAVGRRIPRRCGDVRDAGRVAKAGAATHGCAPVAGSVAAHR
jgi:curved DNA-binding protein CbpA